MNIRAKFVNLEIEKRAYINGRYVNSNSSSIIEKSSSYDGRDLSGIAACDENDVNQAVLCAQAAYDSGIWRKRPLDERKRILLNLADLMEKHIEELAYLDTLETSRAYRNYRNDSLPKAIETLRYSAECVDKYYEKAIPPTENEFAYMTRIPLGVVAVITPWNDPMVVDAWKYAPALLMGNSVILKPAEQSSLSAIRLASLTKEVGIPDGVFNVLPGYGDVVGKALALNNDVRGVFFTGSTSVGKQIIQYSGQSNMKKVGLECGGKSPFIVSDKCKDISRAARILAENVFYNEGQICTAPSLALVCDKVYDKFIEDLKKDSVEFIPGDPFDTDNNVGCVVSRAQYDRVSKYIRIAESDGGIVFQPHESKSVANGACCIKPTIITGLPLASRAAKEEIFGPVVIVIKVSSVDEAVKIANNTEYGLAGAIFTDDLNEAYHVSNAIEAGLVHVNSWGEDQNITPFGGIKQSGIGKDRSMYAFDEYSQLKTVWISFKGHKDK